MMRTSIHGSGSSSSSSSVTRKTTMLTYILLGVGILNLLCDVMWFGHNNINEAAAEGGGRRHLSVVLQDQQDQHAIHILEGKIKDLIQEQATLREKTELLQIANDQQQQEKEMEKEKEDAVSLQQQHNDKQNQGQDATIHKLEVLVKDILKQTKSLREKTEKLEQKQEKEKAPATTTKEVGDHGTLDRLEQAIKEDHKTLEKVQGLVQDMIRKQEHHEETRDDENSTKPEERFQENGHNDNSAQDELKKSPLYDTHERQEFKPYWDGKQWIVYKSRFTHHINKLVDLFEEHPRKPCGDKLMVSVVPKDAADNSTASDDQIVTFQQELKDARTKVVQTYRETFEKRILQDLNDFEQQKRIFPLGNLTMYISTKDKIKSPETCALGSSATHGYYSVYNWQEIRHWRDEFSWGEPLPWDERSKIPVWRGTAYVGLYKVDTDKLEAEFEQNWKHRSSPGDKRPGETFLGKALNQSVFHRRLHLCKFAKEHPELVNARVSNGGGIKKEWWQQNATNGFHIFLPFDQLPKKEYMNNYQVSIVMGGLGAAFRTARIMGQGTAVMLQEYPWEEWFVQYMVPFVHYIPLAQDLHNLEEMLTWIQENPQRVRDIAINGKAFYDKYLSYEAMDEFYYELVFRLLLKVNNIDYKTYNDDDSDSPPAQQA